MLTFRALALRQSELIEESKRLRIERVNASLLQVITDYDHGKFTKNIYRERFHSRDYRPYWFTETKESFCIKIEFNSQRFRLGHQHGRHFFVLGHQHGRRDVM